MVSKFMVIFFLCTLVKAQFKDPIVAQTQISLSNSHGIPFINAQGDIYLDGFAVDSTGYFYFIGGRPAMLVKYSPSGKILMRKKYSAFSSNAIQVMNGKIYIFDKYRKNTLTILDADNGKFIRQYPRIINNTVNSCWYGDSSFVLETFNRETPITSETKMGYLRYNYYGEYLGLTVNHFGIKNTFIEIIKRNDSDKIKYGNPTFIGYIKDTLIFNYLSETSNDIIFCFLNKDFHYLFENTIKLKQLGSYFVEAPYQHWRLMNRKIYALMMKGKNAQVTTLSVDQMIISEKLKHSQRAKQ